jgi:hypothetical protein
VYLEIVISKPTSAIFWLFILNVNYWSVTLLLNKDSLCVCLSTRIIHNHFDFILINFIGLLSCFDRHILSASTYTYYRLPNADVKDFSNGSTTPVNRSYLRYNACRRHSGPPWCVRTQTASEYIIVLLIMFFSHEFVK